MRIRAKAASTAGVRASSKNSAPAATATAGLTYVMTVARVGPASLISSRKATKATAVQMTPRPASAVRVSAEGIRVGRVSAAAGAYTRAAKVRQTVVSWRDGTCWRWRAAISGATA
ncbi:hypothetical protein [Streptomyces sp. SID7804]|uniref:hypothetical protein n=1 Tax=Streptomyces sp. SID7804 TaxID=2690327 RepID=UPI001F2B23A7|nr:hypothetical protein [Streptomyces sp. SID7804]